MWCISSKGTLELHRKICIVLAYIFVWFTISLKLRHHKPYNGSPKILKASNILELNIIKKGLCGWLGMGMGVYPGHFSSLSPTLFFPIFWGVHPAQKLRFFPPPPPIWPLPPSIFDQSPLPPTPCAPHIRRCCNSFNQWLRSFNYVQLSMKAVPPLAKVWRQRQVQ